MLNFTEIRIPQANLGTPNVLPDIQPHNPGTGKPNVTVDNGMTPEEGAWFGQGPIHNMLPYTMLDGYDRALTDKPLNIAVLENEYLRAEFMLDMGGRLRSLYSKTEKRELLFKNNVFQPANLALRNAWISGGTEWNVGMIGHHPFTCSPLFAARFKNAEGGETLKMYEYERKRGVVFTIMATLKRDILLVRNIIENPSDKDTFIYWWSNTAIEEHPKTRVIVPADTHYCYVSEKGATKVTAKKIPSEAYYPSTQSYASDYFYRIPPQRPRFMSYFDEDGSGMAQFSTPNMLGRKLFLWGTQKEGGRNWNRWLSHDNRYYAEIQAGLLHSQAEHRPMKAHEVIVMTEGYAALTGDIGLLHGEDYTAAGYYAESLINMIGGFDSVNNADGYFTPSGEETIVRYGSGWGAIEEAAREKHGLSPRISNISVFPRESVYNKPEEEFMKLIETGVLPERETVLSEDIQIEYCGDSLIPELKACPENWYSMLQLGCAYYSVNDMEHAKEAFVRSLELKKNPIAQRSLAWMSVAEGKKDEGTEYMKQAVASDGKNYVRLLCDAMRFMQSYGTNEDTLKMIEGAGETYKRHGRIALNYVKSLTAAGRIDEAAVIMKNVPEIADIREGETSTTDIWVELYRAIIARDENRQPDSISREEVFEKHPIPKELDFRMQG